MNGILYFSSTGNSLYIAKKVQNRFGGSIVYIPHYGGNGNEFSKIFIVTPVYSWGLPVHVFELLPRLNKTTELIVIQNYGGMAGNADVLMYKYCLQNGLNIKSVHKMKMPENYTLTFTVPAFYLKSTLRKAEKRTDRILEQIETGEYRIPKEKKTKEKTYLKNKSNWHLIGKRFSVTSKCTLCKKCITVCPANNISAVNNKITFGDSCTACLGCYHRCPNKAIVYKNKRKTDRYINPNVDENDIGKNL